jgi:hypothetical protein
VYQPTALGEPDPLRPILVKNFATLNYYLRDHISIGGTAYWHWEPFNQHNMAMRDPYAKIANNMLFNSGNFNLYADLRLHFPVTEISRMNDMMNRVLQHIDEEEESMFDEVRKSLSEYRQEELGLEMEYRRRILLTLAAEKFRDTRAAHAALPLNVFRLRFHPGTQNFGDTPCLGNASPWNKWMFRVEYLADGADARIAEVS